VANVAFGASVVVNNAYLPELARGVEQVKEKERGWRANVKKVKAWVRGQRDAERPNGQGEGSSQGQQGRAQESEGEHHHRPSLHKLLSHDKDKDTKTPPSYAAVASGNASAPPPPDAKATAAEAELEREYDELDPSANFLPPIPALPDLGDHASAEEVLNARREYTRLLSEYTSRLSSLGVALGYAGGIFVLICVLVPVMLLEGSTFSLRLAIGVSGAWWLLWTFPAVRWLPDPSYYFGAAGRSVSHTSTTSSTMSDSSSGLAARRRRVMEQEKFEIIPDIKRSWVRLFGMLHHQEVRKLSETYKFLLGWFLLSDAFTTITSTAVLFAKTSLGMNATSLTLVGILAPSAGILGALVVPFIQRRTQISTHTIILALVILISFVPLYGVLGFLPHFQNSDRFGGLTTPGEIYGLAVYFGFFLWCFPGIREGFLLRADPARRGSEMVCTL
jgi:hypothetical protein